MPRVCAGIVTFNPDIKRLANNLKNVSKQVDVVFIVDNHSLNIVQLRRIASAFDNVELIENNHNFGIAKALNQMCEKAESGGYKWILTLDQDTIIPTNMVEIMMPYCSYKSIGIICPSIIYEGWDKKNKVKNDTEYVYACMTSASLTRIKAWKRVGGFREDYFIDFVDNEFCMKLSLKNYKIIRLNTIQASHQLGKSGARRLLGIRINYSKHTPLRLYYMSRNNLVFIQEYRKHILFFKEILKLNYVLICELIFAEKKLKALRYIKRGVLDAHKGILGEFKDYE